MAQIGKTEREREVREQYEEITDKLFTDRSAFKDFLSFSGKHYKLPSDHAMMIYHANPNADMVTDYETWKKLGRQVTREQKSIAAFENGNLKHYFDISQTVGKEIKSRWRLDKNTASELTKALSAQEGYDFNSITNCVDVLSDRQTRAGFPEIAGTLQIPAAERNSFVKSASSMVRAVVAARCGYQSSFNYKSADALDLSALDMLHNKAEMEKLLEYIQKNAKAVLLSMEKNINEIQRRALYERGNQADLVRRGQEVLSRNQNGERTDVSPRPEDVRVSGGAVARSDGRGAGADEQADRLLRKSVAEVYGAELPAGYSGLERQNAVGADTAADRQGSRGNGVEFGAGVREEQSPSDNVRGNREVGEDETVGSRPHRDDGVGSPTERIKGTAEADEAPADFISEKSFAEQVDASLNGSLPFYTSLKVCDTPQILLDVGCEQLPMLYTQKHLKNAIKPDSSKEHFHGLEVEQIKKLPELLQNPVMIYDSLSRSDSIVVLTSEFDKNNNPIIASIKPNGEGRYELETIESNFITSVHGRENFLSQFQKAQEQDKILFCDKMKSQEMFERWGLQLSELTNTLDFNTIIHQSRNIVKGSEEKILEDSQENSEQITLDSISDNRATYSTNSVPTITCEWSESAVFEEGKTYSVLEFDTLMKRADSDWIEKRQQEIDKYGNDFNKVYEAYKNGEIERVHLGYAKTKFTVNLPNGNSISERQDIGDGYGGVIDFLSQYSKYQSAAEVLKTAAETEKNRAADEFIGFACSALYENDTVKNAHENSDKQEFALEAEKAINYYFTQLVTEEEQSELSVVETAALYNEFQQNSEFRARIISEVTERVDGNLTNLEQTRQKASEMGIPFSERYFDNDMDENPYAYDGSMSIEDSRIVADAHNLHDFMLEYSDELEKAAASQNTEEFREFFANRAAVALQSSSDHAFDEMRNNRDYLNSISELVSNSLYYEIREEKTLEEHSDEIPADLDKFYVNPEAEQVKWVYYNPDSSAGGQLVTTYMDYDDIFEAMAKKDPLDYLLATCKQTTVDRDMDGFDEALAEFMSDKEDYSSREPNYFDKLFALTEPMYSIFQLKDNDSLREYRFSDSEYLKKHGLYIDRENYNKVYRGRLKASETLEDIYERFNINQPKDFYGHSLSVGDIVAIRKNGVSTVNFVDRVGFTEVPDFTLDREERKARRTLTDNIGLIAENQLASDEMDDLGDKLFDYDNAPKYNGKDDWYIGAGLHADELESLAARYHNGENISAELAQKIYGYINHISFYEVPPTYGIGRVDISSERTDSGITFRTKGGFEITHSWETLGEALITAARQEFDRHEELDRQYREQEEKAKSAEEAPYVTVSSFSNVDFSAIGLDSDRHYTIPEFNEAYANAEKLYIADESNAMKIETIAVTLHFGNKEYNYLPMIGAEYGTLSEIMDDISLVNSSNTFLTQQQKELVAEIEREAQEKSATYSTIPAEQEKHNFRITEETEIGSGGLKTKFQNNIAAIETLKKIEQENRLATPDEQQILAKYVGWGGMPQAFDAGNEQWSKEYKQLRELLTDDEYKAAAESTLNAHYTSPEIIGAMYKALENFGFTEGNVLEPAMGVGNFFGCIPEKMQNSKLYGVELDSITGRIAKQLYPQADVRVQGFEKADFPDNFFDAAIGNVPFGNYGIADKRYDKEHFLVHDYFFAKTLDKVAPGGVVAFITSKGTLDKVNPKVREYLAKRADLIGAIRLPNNAFKGANTEVTSDIIFLQKREKMAVESPDWCYTAKNPDGITVNQYFIDNPDMVLGKLEYTSSAFGQEVTCSPIDGEKLSEQLDRAVSKLRANVAVQKRAERQEKERGFIPATADVRNFTHALVDGKMYFRENNIMTEVSQTGKDLERMKGLHELRLTMRELIDAQSQNCTDDELHILQNKLNEQYDSFVINYGSINDRANALVFRNDDDYNTLCSLENVNAEKKTVEKSDIFTQRTIKPTTEISHVETPQEALQVSIDMKGRVDIEYISELCGKTPEIVTNELVQSEMIYLNPEKYNAEAPFEGYEETSEYLSGNVRVKLRTAEAAAKENPELFSKNVSALSSALPPTIGAGDITAHLGASWIDVQDYENFLKEYLGRNVSFITLRRTVSGEYKLENKTADRSVAAINTYGTERMSAYHIFENLLNHRDVTVKDRVDLGDDKYKYVVNQKQTQLAAEKARQMNAAFSKWVWDNPERREKYVTRYNELFNSIVGRHYDGSHQTFPGMSPSIQLKPHQLDAVMRSKFGGNTLLAHCVGAGKSFEMIAATMEKKRLGLINKACVVVPKALVGQTANEWLRLYPQAKILVAGDNDFSKDNRQKFIGRCCTGDYAAVVMSYEQFEKIPMSVEYRQQFLQKELDNIQAGLDELHPYRDRTSIKDLQREQKRIKAKIEKLLDTAKTKDTSLTFEQLGFDSLVVDEAHNYKNGLVVSKMNNVSGVQTTAAQKSEDILMKTQYLNETYGEKNILFATGTPVTNSMTELYTMQRYLRPDLLNAAGLQNFDDWASNFGEVVSQLELKPAGDGFRTKKRFAKFTNLPELMQMYKEFADIRTADMLNLPVPELEGGKSQTIVAKPNEFQQAYMQVLAKRSEAIHNGTVEPTVDNMLKVTHEARLLGLDARAINPRTENTPDSKVNLCIDKVMEIYQNTAEQKGVQAIFCDIAVNSDDGKFSVYDYIKEELQRRGIPASEICTAGDAKDQKQRNEMFAQLRSGQKRIVLASTSKLGTGANIQTKLAALHHLDIPWKPSDLEQRNGRIIRQGNTFDKVSVFNYVTENTFDAYMMNIIVTKQKFISQLMSGKTPARTCEDVDEMVLNYSEMQALATGDPRIKEKIELDGEVSRLRTLESEHYNNKYKLEDVLVQRKAELKTQEKRLVLAKSDKEFAEKQSEEFSVKLNGKTYTERTEAADVLAKEIQRCIVKHDEIKLGEYKGFEITLSPPTSLTASFATINLKRDGGLNYSTNVEFISNLGDLTRMENIVKIGIDKEITNCENTIARDKSDIEQATKTLTQPFEFADELAEKTARLEQLNAELDCGRNEEVFISEDNDKEEKPPELNQDKHTPKHPKR